MVEVGNKAKCMELLGEILPFDVLRILKPIAKANFVLAAFLPDCCWDPFSCHLYNDMSTTKSAEVAGYSW